MFETNILFDHLPNFIVRNELTLKTINSQEKCNFYLQKNC